MKIRSAIAVVITTLGAITLTAVPAAALDAHCGMTIIDRGTTVTFTSDLDCGVTPGITIAADDVTLDLGGHILEGARTNPFGIRVVGPNKRATITNGSVLGFSQGITIDQGFETVVTSVRVKEPLQEGVVISNSAYLTIADLTLDGDGLPRPSTLPSWDGMSITTSHDFTVERVSARAWSASGLVVRNSHDFSVTDSTFDRNVGTSVFVAGLTTSGVMSRLTITNSEEGLGVASIPDPGTGAPTLSVDHVTAQHCELGLGAAFSYGIVFDSVTAADNDTGVSLGYASDAITVRNSTFHDNVYDGLSVSSSTIGASGVRIEGNHSRNNARNGFAFRGPGIQSRGNSSSGNGGEGFFWTDAAAGTSTGDVAQSNGRAGFAVATTTGRVRIASALGSKNGRSGVEVVRGAAVVSRGSFDQNSLQGIDVTSGRVDVLDITARYNARSGVHFGAAAAGSVARVTATNNRVYGLAIARGATVTDYRGHTLFHNGVRDYCRGTCPA